MVRLSERATATADFGHPVDLGFCNGLGILMRERRRMNRRDELPLILEAGGVGRDICPWREIEDCTQSICEPRIAWHVG